MIRFRQNNYNVKHNFVRCMIPDLYVLRYKMEHKMAHVPCHFEALWANED